MNRELKTFLYSHIKRNFSLYLVLGSVFIAGFGLAFSARKPAESYMTDVFNHFQNTESSFLLAFRQHILYGAVVLLASFSAVGLPCILLGIGWNGFCYGTVFAGVIGTYGMKSIWIVICGILPHTILFLPCLFLYSCFCAKNTFDIYTRKFEWKFNMLTPAIYGILFVACVSVVAFMQAYAEPWLLSLITA